MGYDAEYDMRRYKRFSGFIKTLLIICGVWPNCHPIRDMILSFLAAFSTFYGTATIFNFCLHHVTNVMILTKGMGLVITFFLCFLKIFVMLLHREDVIHLNRSLSARFTSDLENTTDRRLLLSRLTSISSFCYLHAAFSILAIVMYAMTPLLALRHGKYPRIYPSVLPFTYTPGGLVHWCLFGLELSGFFYLFATVIGVDYLFGLYALQICGELRILAGKFQELRTGDDYQARFRDCVQRHHLLIRSKKRIESAFGFLAMYLAISGAFVLCSLAFQISEAIKTEITPIQMGKLVFYIGGKIMQSFSYAWYGNLVAEEVTLLIFLTCAFPISFNFQSIVLFACCSPKSKACLNAIYNAHWPDSGDTRLRGDILFVITQKPMIFVAKGCMQLHLDLFSKLVNTSVSYFFLLQTLNEK